MALWIGDYPNGWHHVNVKNKLHKKTVNEYTRKPAGNEKVQPESSTVMEMEEMEKHVAWNCFPEVSTKQWSKATAHSTASVHQAALSSRPVSRTCHRHNDAMRPLSCMQQPPSHVFAGIVLPAMHMAVANSNKSTVQSLNICRSQLLWATIKEGWVSFTMSLKVIQTAYRNSKQAQISENYHCTASNSA